MSCPSSNTSPPIAAPGIISCIRLRMRRKVDLPQPEGPISAVTLPASMCSDTRSSTSREPNHAEMFRASIPASADNWPGSVCSGSAGRSITNGATVAAGVSTNNGGGGGRVGLLASVGVASAAASAGAAPRNTISAPEMRASAARNRATSPAGTRTPKSEIPGTSSRVHPPGSPCTTLVRSRVSHSQSSPASTARTRSASTSTVAGWRSMTSASPGRPVACTTYEPGNDCEAAPSWDGWWLVLGSVCTGRLRFRGGWEGVG